MCYSENWRLDWKNRFLCVEQLLVCLWDIIILLVFLDISCSAILTRGECMFMDKVIRAQNVGAIGMVVMNELDDTLFMMVCISSPILFKNNLC